MTLILIFFFKLSIMLRVWYNLDGIIVLGKMSLLSYKFDSLHVFVRNTAGQYSLHRGCSEQQDCLNLGRQHGTVLAQ